MRKDHERKVKEHTDLQQHRKKEIAEELRSSRRSSDAVTLTSLQEEQLANFRREAEAERDRRIQAEIRVIQTECIRVEVHFPFSSTFLSYLSLLLTMYSLRREREKQILRQRKNAFSRVVSEKNVRWRVDNANSPIK